MPESPQEDATRSPEPAAGLMLLVLIAPNTKILDDVATALLDLGVAGTAVEAKGLMTLMREEMPIFSGLASMLPETLGSKMVFSVVSPELAERVFDLLEDEFKPNNRPIAFSLKLDRTLGIRH